MTLLAEHRNTAGLRLGLGYFTSRYSVDLSEFKFQLFFLKSFPFFPALSGMVEAL